MTTILDGKKLANKILKDLKEKTQPLSKKPSLAVILANDNPSSKIYVSSKEKCAIELGYQSLIYKFDNTVTQGKLISLIHELNQNKDVNGILIQLPLFKHLDAQQLIEIINPKKDVDGFHPINVGRLNCGLKPYAICCTPKGIMRIFEEYKINLKGKNVIVIGRSNIVGKPLIPLLLGKDATVSVAHSKTKNLKEITKTKDIIISATGIANLVTADMVKKGAIVIDVGISKQTNLKIMGDVNFEEVKNIASYITPVPGGVGPMTIASLMENTFELYLEQNKDNAKL